MDTLHCYQDLATSPKHFLFHQLPTSINTAEYNCLVPYLLCVPLHLLGGGRIAYCLLIYFLMLVPSALLLSLFATTFATHKHVPFWLMLFVCCSLPTLNATVFMAMYDLLSMLLLIVAMIISYFYANPFAQIAKIRQHYYMPILLGLLYFFTLVARRTFLIALIAFGCSILLFYLIALIGNKNIPKRQLLISFLYYHLLACICAIVLLAVLFPGLWDMLLSSTNYTWQYSAYQSGNNLITLPLALGLPCLLVILFGFLLSIAKKQKETLTVYIFGFLYITITCTLFWRIQSMALHHWLLIAGMVAFMLLIAINAIAFKNKMRRWRVLFICGICLYSSFSCWFATFGKPGPTWLFSNVTSLIYTRNDMVEINALADRVQDAPIVYVCAGTETLSNATLQRSLEQRGITPRAKFVSSIVDLRDGLSPDLFNATYIIASSPSQTDLQETSEHVVTDLNAMIFDPTSTIGSHLQLRDTYTLEKDVTAYLYVVTERWTYDEQKAVIAHFAELYPEHADVFWNQWSQ